MSNNDVVSVRDLGRGADAGEQRQGPSAIDRARAAIREAEAELQAARHRVGELVTRMREGNARLSRVRERFGAALEPDEALRLREEATELEREQHTLRQLQQRFEDQAEKAAEQVAARQTEREQLLELAEATFTTVHRLEEDLYTTERAWEEAQRTMPVAVEQLEQQLDRARTRYAGLVGESAQSRQRREAEQRRRDRSIGPHGHAPEGRFRAPK